MIVMTTNHERRLMTRLPNYRPVPVRSGEFLKIMFMRMMLANMVVMVIVMVSSFGSYSLGPL